MMGHETSFRMPLHDLFRLRDMLSADWIDTTDMIRSLRMVKSEAEIGLLKQITSIASDAFEALPQQLEKGRRWMMCSARSSLPRWRREPKMCPILSAVPADLPMMM